MATNRIHKDGGGGGASALASQLDASSRPLLVLAPNEDLRPAHFQ